MSCEHPRQRRIRKLVDLGGCLYLFLNALVCFVLLRETPKLLTHLAKNMFCDSFFKCLRVLSTSQKYPEAQKMLTPPSQNHFFDRLHSFTRCIFLSMSQAVCKHTLFLLILLQTRNGGHASTEPSIWGLCPPSRNFQQHKKCQPLTAKIKKRSNS